MLDDARVDAVRRFNRLYTRHIGVLQDGYLHSPYSLAEVRVLYELAHRDWTTSTELARDLDLDAGYLSRILRKFEDAAFVQRKKSERDGRESLLSLTLDGMAAFEPLEAGAREQIAALLSTLPELQQRRLLRAMAAVEAILGSREAPAVTPLPAAVTPRGPVVTPAYILRSPQPGDFGWVVQRHGALYHEEYGWDLTFESLVASIVARFIDHYDPERERCWIAERLGEPVGCVFLVKASPRVAKLRLFLVEPDARGLGIGSHMVDELIAFARAAQYRKIRLWTQSVLLAARRIYARNGFLLVDEEPNHSFGADLVSETWELRL